MFYKRTAGVWTYQEGRPYVRRPGTGWTPVIEGYVKRSGAWAKFFTYDATPPAAPTLTLTEVETTYQSGGETLKGRHIEVLAKPSVTDLSVRRVRVLVSPTSQPTSQYDQSSYIAGSDAGSTEPWSEIYYNGYNGATRLSTSSVTRNWTRAAVTATVVPAGKYYFSAWSEDFAGNWSPGNFKTITLGAFTSSFPTQTLRVSPVSSGTWDPTFHLGDLVQGTSPTSKGMWWYSTKISAPFNQATNPSIKNAQIYIQRRNQGGNDVARISLAWHTRAAKGAMTEWEGTGGWLVGNLGKGEAKWFDIPPSLCTRIENGEILGFSLQNRVIDNDPDTVAGPRDASIIRGVEDGSRSGEVYIVWADEA